MAEVTYYFNSRSTGNWTDPDNMIDGLIANFASTSSNGTEETLDGNTCPGDDLGTITKVEARIYGYGDADDRLYYQPIFDAGLGNARYHVSATPTWTNWVQIQNDPNAPDPFTWADVLNLDYKVLFTKTGKANTMRCAKVEIRVTYTEAGAKTTQYLNGNDCPVFPHNMNVDSGKLPCPPPY